MYKLDKTKVIKGVVELFPETLKSGIGFFGCGAATGLCCIVANMPINPNNIILCFIVVYNLESMLQKYEKNTESILKYKKRVSSCHLL